MEKNAKVEKTLAHYGVLGMHWGKHLPGKTEESHNPKPRKVRPEPHKDHVETRALKSKHPSELSTAELKRINDRLQTEKKNKELDPKGLSKGKKIALGIIAAAGTGVTVYNLVNGQAGKASIAVGKQIAFQILKPALAGNGKHVLIEAGKVAAKHL